MNQWNAGKPTQVASVKYYRTPDAVAVAGADKARICQVYRMHIDFGLYICAIYIIFFGVVVKIVGTTERLRLSCRPISWAGTVGRC